VRFNPENRTINGFIEENTTVGTLYEFEIVFRDQQGKEAMTNFKIKILPPLPSKIRKVVLLMVLNCSSLIVLSIFIAYLYSYYSTLNKFFQPSEKELHSITAR
jgi:hypothetical protein